jgi:hypothetical protein
MLDVKYCKINKSLIGALRTIKRLQTSIWGSEKGNFQTFLGHLGFAFLALIIMNFHKLKVYQCYLVHKRNLLFSLWLL